ncbi:hypothetical protein GEMRC1_003522 [Eukaryota sp. GEM-RC1]
MEKASSSLPTPNSLSPLTLRYATELCRAVKFLHLNSIVHGDLKPANILLVDDQVRVADFGTSRNIAATTLVTAVNAMTPKYAAPEQFDLNSAEPGSDIYSLGLVLYELLTGREAFKGYPVLQLFAAKMRGTSLPFEDPTPECLRNIISLCLNTNTSERPKIDEILQILNILQNDFSSNESDEKRLLASSKPFLRLKCENEFCLDVSHQHLSIYQHSPEIADDPYDLNSSDDEHKYVCPNGSTCERQRDPEHLARFIHVFKPQCLNGETCQKLDEHHLGKFSHPGVLEIRNDCPDYRCDDFSREHRYQYSHKLDYVTGITGNLKLYRAEGMKKVDFGENCKRLKAIVDPYFDPYSDSQQLIDLITSVSRKLLSFKPVHCLSRDSFQSSIKFDSFFSLHTAATSTENNRDFAEHLKTHRKLIKFENFNEASNVLIEWTSYCLNHYENFGFGNKSMPKAVQNTCLLDREKLELISLGKDLGKTAVQLRDAAITIINTDLQSRDLRIYRAIYCNLGPSLCDEVTVYFKNSINRHPATFVNLSTANVNRYHSPTHDDFERVSKYYQIIQNLGNLETAEVLAKYLIQTVQKSLDKPLNEITEADVISFFFSIHSHSSIEVHLPSRVPLTDVDHVMMSRDVFDSFTDDVKVELHYLNRIRDGRFLVFTDHAADSIECRKEQLELLTSDPNYQYGYNFVLHQRDCFCEIPAVICPIDDVIGLRFGVMTCAQFELELHSSGGRIVSILFNQGNVSLDSMSHFSKHKLYFPSQCRNFYIKFGVVFDLEVW